MLRNVPTDPTDGEFDALPADADDEARQGLAERMAPHIRRIQAENRAVAAPDSDAPRGKRFVSEIAAAAMRELDTPAQLDVFRRVQALLRAEPPVGTGTSGRDVGQPVAACTAGVRPAHGRAVSSSAATSRRWSSRRRRAASWIPTGRPSSSTPSGRETAGWPVQL